MEKYYPFPCDCCGECCRHIDKIPELKDYCQEDGVCKFLRDDNKCSIYANRPNVCNGKFVYEQYFSDMTVEEFHNFSKELCKMIKRGVGFD